ncbi:hypothetical protein L1887_24981 [Cichorium endivia]|nr:hypothetical protein L1887_24981 [Cichorium endivia]
MCLGFDENGKHNLSKANVVILTFIDLAKFWEFVSIHEEDDCRYEKLIFLMAKIMGQVTEFRLILLISTDFKSQHGYGSITLPLTVSDSFVICSNIRHFIPSVLQHLICKLQLPKKISNFATSLGQTLTKAGPVFDEHGLC